MANTSGITWTDSTFNPWIGCTKVGPGCDNCYAEVLMGEQTTWGAGLPRRRTKPSNWHLPRRWNNEIFLECIRCGHRSTEKEHQKAEAKHGSPCCENRLTTVATRRVFCASLSDVFDNEVDPAWRADLFALINETPHLEWMLLTKRVGNVASMIEGFALPENLLIGATIVNQEEADRDIPKLRAIPGVRRFLSMEPLLGSVDLISGNLLSSPGLNPIDWVIIGGESGANARPMVVSWAERIVRDCLTVPGVKVHMKQLGAKPVSSDGSPWPITDDKGKDLNDWPPAIRIREFPSRFI